LRLQPKGFDMSEDSASNSPIVAAYIARTPRSALAYATARDLMPGGVTHDVRYMRPHPIYVDQAGGVRKHDVDGNIYVDYQGGHGALILGHSHPEVTARISEQLARGTHYGANHEMENRWAALICDMVPSAELVRFTNSGTGATMMALRLARAATGRKLLLRFRGHFHGWHDHVAFGVVSHFDGTPTPGVIPELAENVVLVIPNDAAGLRAALAEHGADIAAAIIEPTGSIYGQVPVEAAFVQTLRDETKRLGIVLIFDEVVTGFRVAGGAYAAKVRDGARQVLIDEGVAWGVYGSHTGFHIFVNPDHLDIDPARFDAQALGFAALKIPRGNPVGLKLRMAMRLHGVDLSAWPGGPCSAAHDAADLDQTLTALQASVRSLREEREIP
jgi:glutamate-1-semialdehyde aminotransferase